VKPGGACAFPGLVYTRHVVKALAFLPLLALAVVSPAGAGGNVPATAPSLVADAVTAPPPESLVVGAIQSLSVSRCVLSYQLQVTADAGGGTDAFRLEVYDEGQLVRAVTLSVPADGAVHGVAGTIGLPPISQAAPGIGVVLSDATVLDIEDPFVASCVPLEVPAVGPFGLVGLTTLLLVAGLVVVRRRAAGA
jgi:hypothetical protein